MTHRTLLAFCATVAFSMGCTDQPTVQEQNADAAGAESRAVEEAITCDPIVGEFRDLMVDYESGLKEMIAANKVDPERQKRWMEKSKALNERIQARGEKELGQECWREFNTINQEYLPRITQLGMQLSMIQMGDKMDPATQEAMKKAMGQ